MNKKSANNTVVGNGEKKFHINDVDICLNAFHA